MLSNDLISLSVNPVSHQRPPLAATPHVRKSRLGWGVAAASSHSVLIKNRIEASISENMSRQSDWRTQGERDFGMKVLGDSFTSPTLLVR